jgi:hypothetical protein
MPAEPEPSRKAEMAASLSLAGVTAPFFSPLPDAVLRQVWVAG